MRAPVNVFTSLWLVTTAQLALLAGVAAAQDAAPTAEPGSASRSHHLAPGRWVPSLAIESGVTIQEWKADVTSSCVGCTNTPPSTNLRDPVSGDDRDVTPFVGSELELMSPELPIPLSPRVFIGGSSVAAFGTERKVAQQGNVGTIRSPIPEQAQSSNSFSEDTALGQGSELSAQMATWIFGAKLGLAFPVELFGRSVRIKPSAGWIRYGIEVEGHLADAECRTVSPAAVGFGTTNCNPLTIPPGQGPGVLRTIQFSEHDQSTWNGVGGGLDIEMDVFRIGPFGSSLYIGAAAYKVLGNRDIDFTKSESFPSAGVPGLGAADTSGNFKLEVDPVIYRAGLGFRMHWVGSGGGQ